MSSVILDFINLNQNMDYSIIIPAVILYLLIFWVIVSGWLYFDAKRRYRSSKKALIIALLNLVFQLPFLVFYLLVRPYDGEEQFMETEAANAAEQSLAGGVNVPLINFTGNDGVVMTLELKINPSKLATESHPEMKIDVNFESGDPNKQLVVKPVQTSVSQTGDVKVSQSIGEVVKVEKPAGIAGKVKSAWLNWRKAVRTQNEAAAASRKAKEEAKQQAEKDRAEATGESSDDASKKQKKKKHKKKH